MQDMQFMDTVAFATHKMSTTGIFLNVGGEQPNTMTVAWGSFGFFWSKPVITLVVRPQRHTHPMLIDAQEFTISIPYGAMTEELKFAGTASGRDVDKFQGHGLTAAPARLVSAPIVAECELHYECKVRLMQSMTSDRMDTQLSSAIYPTRDFHTLFFGEVVACYASGAIPGR